MTAKAMLSSSRKNVLVEEPQRLCNCPVVVPHSDVGLKCSASQPGEAAAHCSLLQDRFGSTMASRSRQPRGREGKENKARKRRRGRKRGGGSKERVEKRRKKEGRRGGGRVEKERGGVGGVFLLSVQHGGEYISTVFGYI